MEQITPDFNQFNNMPLLIIVLKSDDVEDLRTKQHKYTESVACNQI